MKNYLSKTLTCLFFAAIALPALAQQSQATTAPKVTDSQIKSTNANTVASLMSNIQAIVTLTDDQKTKLQAGLQDIIEKSEKVRHAMKDDDGMQEWREKKVADIKAQLKAVLTPEQYDQVIKQGSN